MANPVVSGQVLLDQLKIQLGGLSNAFTVDQMLYFLNSAKDETWSVLKTLDLDYFTDSSQDTDSTKDDYFLDLSSTVREYALPVNCREIRAIECLTANYQDRVFEYHRFDDPIFMEARRQSTSVGLSISSVLYYFTIFGGQLVFAQWPETVLNLKLWYIASIDDIDAQGLPAILFPFSNKIVDYAAKRAILSTQNVELSMAWKEQWQESVKTLAMSAGPRESTNPIFISDFCG